VAAVPRIVVLGTSGAGKTTVARRLLPHGNRERWRLAHATWVVWEVRSHLRRRVRMKARLARHPGLSVVHLRSQGQVDAWLDDIEASAGTTAGPRRAPRSRRARLGRRSADAQAQRHARVDVAHDRVAPRAREAA
jgi:hypothetical protein